MTRRTAAATALVLGLLATLLAGCGSEATAGRKHQTLTVFAASSLTKSFTAIGHEFEAAHPGVTVRFGFGGSSDLVAQVQAGAPADVFASADTKNMDKLGDEARDPQAFATNTLEIAVPPGNPGGIHRFQDLAKPGIKLVVCAPEVPCGAAAQRAAQAAGTTLKPVSEEQSVTDVLGKVRSGEADAGVVYVTDVKAAGSDVQGIPFPEAAQAVNTYPIAALSASKHAALAKDFVAFVLGATGRRVLADAGFGSP